jgi:hypothetical protein
MAKDFGGLTGSINKSKNRGRSKTTSQKPDKSALERLQESTSAVTNTVGAVADAVQTVGNGAKQLRRSVGGGSKLVDGDTQHTIDAAQDLAASYGLQIENLGNTLNQSNFDIDDSIPQMSAKEANQLNLTIERQNNALDVQHNRIKQKRRQVRNHKEEWQLVSDLVDLDTAKIDVGTKVVKHEIAATKLQTEQSRLEETEELLEHQTIRTQGTIGLTEGIRREWDLKLEKQHRQLEALEIEIEQQDNRNARKREEVESFLFTE